MGSQTTVTMDFINIILLDMVLVKLNLMRELVTPLVLRWRDSSSCLVPTDLALTLFRIPLSLFHMTSVDSQPRDISDW